jgi:hypothetical protein
MCSVVVILLLLFKQFVVLQFSLRTLHFVLTYKLFLFCDVLVQTSNTVLRTLNFCLKVRNTRVSSLMLTVNLYITLCTISSHSCTVFQEVFLHFFNAVEFSFTLAGSWTLETSLCLMSLHVLSRFHIVELALALSAFEINGV